MSNHVVYSISSVFIGAYTYHTLKSADGWCPVGRVVANLLFFLFRVCFRSRFTRMHPTTAGEQNVRFEEHRAFTNRQYQSGRIAPIRALTVLKNACFAVTWVFCNHSDISRTDEFTLVFFAMILTQSRFMRLVCCLACARLLYTHGMSFMYNGAYSACLIACTWLMRDPYISSGNWILFALYWAYMASIDGTSVCTNMLCAVPPLVPIFVAVSRFHARPISILILSTLPALL